MNLPAAILALAPVSFAISFLLTLTMKHVAPRIGFVDKPGGRKIHANPKPLGGGVAIFLGFALPVLIGLAIIQFVQPPKLSVVNLSAYWSGVRDRTPAGLEMVGAALLMHLLGLWDDRKALGPYFKLFVQLSIISALVLLNPEQLRMLPFLGPYVSIIVSALWIAAVTNAFNFLDNMDGLSAGVAAVCTSAFLVATLSIQQWFVAASLSLLLGSLLGFLCFNFSPASIFMGDSGSLVIGLLLGTLTVRTTFVRDATLGAGWYVIFAPVIVLAVPLYDLVVVSAIRLMRGKSPFVGDTNHFSHRLVARGMSRRTSVLCLYLISAATAVAAVILAHAPSTFVAVMVFVQTILILGVVMLLEQHPLPMPRKEDTETRGRPDAKIAGSGSGPTMPAPQESSTGARS